MLNKILFQVQVKKLTKSGEQEHYMLQTWSRRATHRKWSILLVILGSLRTKWKKKLPPFPNREAFEKLGYSSVLRMCSSFQYETFWDTLATPLHLPSHAGSSQSPLWSTELVFPNQVSHLLATLLSLWCPIDVNPKSTWVGSPNP